MINLHLGCGWRNFGPDWIHIDSGDYEHLDKHDVTLLSYVDNSVDLIYASHLFEYFDRERGREVLKEWYRVLKPEGKLRIAVPDFEKMVKLYNNGDVRLQDILGPLYGKMSMSDEIIYHKTTYDEIDLKSMLSEAGFRQIFRYDWRDYEVHRNNDDHSQAYLSPKGDKENGQLISLNLEAVK